MRTVIVGAIALVMLCLGLASCGGGGGQKGQFEFTGNPERFSLNVLDDSALGGELHGEFELKRHDEGDTVVLELQGRSVEDLRALYCEVEFNPNLFTPASAERSTLLGQAGVLELAVLDVPGTVTHGQLLIHPDEHSGFSGDGVLATMRFTRRPMEEFRTVSTPPSDPASQSMPQFDSVSGELSWLYRSTGDYDQNGLITISDLTPMGVNFGESDPDGFADTSVLSVVDGDGNNVINISDITPIGIGFGRSTSGGYNIYRSGSADEYPATPLGENGNGAQLLGNLPFSTAVGNPTVDRLAFSFEVSDPQTPGFYWIRPQDGAGNEGYASTMVSPPDGSLPVLSVPLPPAEGSGSLADPYVVKADDSVQFMLVDADSNDVTTDMLSSFTATPAEAAGFGTNDGLLTVKQGYVGAFSVSASFDGLSAAQVIRFSVGPPDGSPVAILNANKQYGSIPLSVSFDAGDSLSPGGEGFIVDYAFDWEDDGVYDDFGTTTVKSHSYAETGQYTARLRVTDNKDRTAEATLNILAYLPNGPNAQLVATPFNGQEPLPVDLDASGSTPKPDTEIVEFQFDFDNDFAFDDGTNSTGLLSTVFETAGVIPARVKVIDDNGLFTVAERKVTVSANAPPTALLALDPEAPYYLPATIDIDASGSSDIDGNIIGYSFDFDGDGEFDYEGLDANHQYTYDVAGDYTITLKVTDNGQKTGMQSIPISVFEDDRPVAELVADVTSGLNPLTVNFDATGSTDPENMIVAYEWDFNGDGDFSDLSETTGVAQFDYISAGNFEAGVRVRDADDNTSIATVTIAVTENKAPNADVRADKLSGFTPVTVEFDGSNSTDLDGTIELYEWDVDGDDDFDDGYGNVDTISIFYDNTGGAFTIKLRVTDDKFKSSTDSVTVNITNNLPPVADIQADVTSGFRPLHVNFDATASIDPDGTIANYRWDFDYDGVSPSFELEGAEDQPQWIFNDAGGSPFTVLLEVIDNGGKSSQATIEITVMDNDDPEASLTANGMVFDLNTPTPIEFDASGSMDVNGDVITADWDFDGDGTFEIEDADKEVPQQYSGWSLPGMYLATVIITDEHGASDSAIWPVTVTGGQPPPTVTMSSPCVQGEAPLAVYFDADGSDSNGVIEKYEFDYDGPVGGWNWQESGKADKASALYTNTGTYFAWVRVTDDDGAYGLASLEITVDDQYDLVIVDPTVNSSDWMDAAIVDGRPAIAYASSTSQLRFVIANDAQGTSWQDPQVLNTDNASHINIVELGNGRAGIMYYTSLAGMKFLRATDSTNSAWTSPVVVEASADNKDMRMIMLEDDHPAVAYFVGTNLKYKRCLDVDGDLPASWPAAAVTIDTTASQPMEMELVFLHPAIAYRDGYARSADQVGTSWPDLYSTGITGGSYYSLLDVGNQPRILHDQGGYSLVGSNDSGATWPVDVEIDGGTSGGRFNTGLHSGTQYITAASRTISASNFTVPISRQFYLFDSLDAAGNTWNTAYALDSLLEQGLGAEMLDIGGGEIGVAYRGSHNGNSKILKWQVTAQNP
ncbi:MAG: hypothetical protein H7A35_15720 [Planctomycetales bacterium]|nr:hypothetical protein [bacterium]UNM08276.1 MAG: hypothetical protein H7A35_15720 [Planctomycetales bacterium]